MAEIFSYKNWIYEVKGEHLGKRIVRVQAPDGTVKMKTYASESEVKHDIDQVIAEQEQAAKTTK